MFHMFQVIYAHEWMNDAHDYEMQVQSGKTNTRGVTTNWSSIHLLFFLSLKKSILKMALGNLDAPSEASLAVRIQNFKIGTLRATSTDWLFLLCRLFYDLYSKK